MACFGQIPQGEVAAMAVTCIRRPSLQDPLGTVTLSDLPSPVAEVGDQVDPRDLTQCNAPVGVTVVGNHLARLVVCHSWYVSRTR